MKKKDDYSMADVNEYHRLIDEYHKTMPFSEAIIKAQETIASMLTFRRKNAKRRTST